MMILVELNKIGNECIMTHHNKLPMLIIDVKNAKRKEAITYFDKG